MKRKVIGLIMVVIPLFVIGGDRFLHDGWNYIDPVIVPLFLIMLMFAGINLLTNGRG